jgi:D-alanine-D-alanine ligase
MAKEPVTVGFIDFIKSKEFIRQLVIIAAAFIILILLTQFWLSYYTNHGQKLDLPKFIGMKLEDAISLAEERTFEIIVDDSIFVVGKPGGIITDQNPKPKSLVKENRKIYVTITKYGTETVKVSDLPILYGNAFDQKRSELKYRDIECTIKDYAYDPGEPNHILEVWYQGDIIISKDIKKNEVEIPKGGTLEFVISQRDGGDVTIPDLRCLQLEEARFLLESSKLRLGDTSKKGSTEPDATLYVISQSPPYDGVSNVKMGERINVTVSAVRPPDCN